MRKCLRAALAAVALAAGLAVTTAGPAGAGTCYDVFVGNPPTGTTVCTP